MHPPLTPISHLTLNVPCAGEPAGGGGLGPPTTTTGLPNTGAGSSSNNGVGGVPDGSTTAPPAGGGAPSIPVGGPEAGTPGGVCVCVCVVHSCGVVLARTNKPKGVGVCGVYVPVAPPSNTRTHISIAMPNKGKSQHHTRSCKRIPVRRSVHRAIAHTQRIARTYASPPPPKKKKKYPGLGTGTGSTGAAPGGGGGGGPNGGSMGTPTPPQGTSEPGSLGAGGSAATPSNPAAGQGKRDRVSELFGGQVPSFWQSVRLWISY